MKEFRKQLHWYNIPELESKPSSLTNTGLAKIMLSVGYDIYSYGKPTFVYLYNMTIPEIDDINHSLTAIDTLNKTGIDFYLYEPLSLKTSNQISDFDNIVFNESTDITSDELDSILRYVRRNNLTNVTVYVGDYEVKRYLKQYTPYMNLVVKDLHLLTIDPILPKVKGHSLGFSRKFINLNRRYCSYRHILAAYLSKRSTHMSWFHNYDLPKETEWYNINNWDSNIVDKLDFDLSPKFLDCADISVLDQNSPSLEKYYRESFCDIIGESRFHRPMGNVSEKVFKPIFYKKPFILAAPARSLEYLKSLGFKTFSDFWDESYDTYDNHEKRITKILTVIDFIDNMSLTELRFMYEQMIPIVEHNFNRANELVLKLLPNKKHFALRVSY